MGKVLGINEKNRKLLEILNQSDKKIFNVEEASKILHFPINKTRLFLSYSARRGWLSRVNRGLYVCVPLGTVNPQEYKENPFLVANRIFSPCYIGGWSAAEYWDFTEQIFTSICVFTYKMFRKKKTIIQGTEFVLKHLNKKVLKHTKNVWVENVKVQFSDPCQTLIDILDDPSIGGGIRNVSDVIQNYFNSDLVEEEKLLKYIDEFGNKTIYKRLGFLLEVLKIDSKCVIETCKKNISLGYSVLDPTIDNKGVYNRRWNLRVNVQIR